MKMSNETNERIIGMTTDISYKAAAADGYLNCLTLVFVTLL